LVGKILECNCGIDRRRLHGHDRRIQAWNEQEKSESQSANHCKSSWIIHHRQYTWSSSSRHERSARGVHHEPLAGYLLNLSTIWEREGTDLEYRALTNGNSAIASANACG
jgi:hypothetical protein